MDNNEHINILINNGIKFKLFHFPFFIFIILIQLNKICSEYLDSLNASKLNEQASLIDITDYYNLSIVITTDKKIYSGIPPSFKSETNSKITNISSAVTYNKNYILMACTEDNLLSQIKIDSGVEIPLVAYGDFNFPYKICSISIKNNYVYIGVNNLIVPTYKFKIEKNISYENLETIGINNFFTEINEANCSDININNVNEEDNYYYIYDYNNSYLQNEVIKIKIDNIGSEENEPKLDEEFQILNYTIEFKEKNLGNITMSRPFSCEILDVDENSSDNHRLVCGYIKKEDKYSLNIFVMNSNFDGIDDEKNIYNMTKAPNIRLQKINSSYIRFLFTNYSYEISLKKEDIKYKIKLTQENIPFSSFSPIGDLFFYNNHYLFLASLSTMIIKKNITKNYLKVTDDDKDIQKIMGYYEYERDILLFIYEYNSKKIKYFTIENTSYLFDFEIKEKIIKVVSNTTTIFNVSEMIINPIDHQFLLDFYNLRYFISTTYYTNSYDKYTFDKDSQILTVNQSLNDWINFEFYYKGKEKEAFSSGFFFDNCSVNIKTCLYKCGHCFSNYSICDYGTCKTNFSLLRESEDKDCYSKDQNIPNYIYNETTKYFEKCYNNCIFCSLIDELSSKKSQNCKACKEGYLKSYTFEGNCYPIEYPYNTSNYSKIINNSEDESFTQINSCFELGKYKINDTGECVISCPQTTVYYDYYLNESFDFQKQEQSSLGLMYPLNKEKPPKFLFNKICYSTCPQLTYEDKNTSSCKCIYGWHYNNDTNEKICYNNTNYCLSLDYYYHTDDKECVLNGCKNGYYQMNFECYKDKCPKNMKQISSESKKCESNLKYCMIDEHYQTQCSNNAFNGYNFKYNETKTYFKSCNESLYYFNIKTYLYKNICYEYCPEETTKNDTNDRCSCNYYIFYVNEEKSDYECLNETEKCWDKKRFNITDKKECVKSKQDCFSNNYKVFNDECLLECPEKTEEKNGDGICLCKFHFYNDSNILNCFDEGKTCETENYTIKMSNTSNTRECFKSKFECIKRGFKFYENECYETCPTYTKEKLNDGICSCLYHYINNSDTLTCFENGTTCETKGYSYINLDTHECFTSIDDCINRELKIFNDNCYSICPINTKEKKNDFSCICEGYFYTEKNGKLNCFSSGKTCKTESSEYIYTNSETKECFKTNESCINRGYKIFNDECLSNCPKNTFANKDNICLCSNFTLIDENGLLKCFESESECASKGYFYNKETKKCFLSSEDCIQNNKKIFGKECANKCPLNSEFRENTNICECSYYFYNNNGILSCFNSDKTCKSEGFPVNSETKECFTSITDCFSKNYSYFFDKTCYKDNCPSGKIPLKSINDIVKKNSLKTALNLDNSISEKICICDTTNTYYGWINEDNSNPSIQKCLYQCPTDYELDSLTDKCIYSCNPQINYVFNDICYKNCPEGTKLDENNSDSRKCVCQGKTIIDENTNFVTCEDIYPTLFYENPEKCPYIYENNCYLKCPEDTCLSTNNKDLVKCVDIKPTTKIYNQICIEGFDELIQNLEKEEISPITTPSGVVLSAFSSDSSMDNLISKYPNLTFVDLGECKEKLKKALHLPPDEKLFILGVDSPCHYGNSSINVFNYEVYLKNGTQIKDLSPCNDVKITISSNINDLESVNFNKAIGFYGEGYDIYNRSNIFYVDPCAPAQDNGNDITLVDRAKYYFPNVSLCNEGCVYKVVDFTTQRFLCNCNANLSEKIYKHEDKNTPDEQNEDDESYLDYFLSLINYKIFLCANLFFEFESFYYNAGFYISFCTLIICFILAILFWIIGIKYIKVLIYKNVPTKEKLKELIKKINRNRNTRSETCRPLKKNKTIKINRLGRNKTKTYKHHKKDIINDFKSKKNTMKIKEIKIKQRKEKKHSTLTGSNLLQNNSNPPPKYQNILKINEFIKLRKKNQQEKENEEDNFCDFLRNNIEIHHKSSKHTVYKEKKYEKKNHDIFIDTNKNQRKKHKNKTAKSTLASKEKSLSSKNNLGKFKNKLIKEDFEKENFQEENRDELITRRDEEEVFFKTKLKKHKRIKKIRFFESKEKKSKSSIQIAHIQIKSIKPINERYHTEKIKIKNKILNKLPKETEKESSIYIHDKKKMVKDLDLKIDFSFAHLIDRTDDDIEKRELNNIPYRQALRIDKRSFFEILFSVFANQIEFISLFLYRNPYSHYTLTISIYLFELLLDLTMNCVLYTDDVVSEKYHNNGDLTKFTSFSLSFISNIISSIIVFIISKLTNYPEIVEAIIKNVKDKKNYINNIVRLFKYIRLRLGFFYFLQLSFILAMTYYLFIFCTIYHQSQVSIMINYIVGACTSLAISVGLTLIISILRALSIKYHHYQLFNISKYLYEHF